MIVQIKIEPFRTECEEIGDHFVEEKSANGSFLQQRRFLNYYGGKMDFSVMRYTEEQENKWDSFVLQDSMNGTFLQTRKFINYHPKDRFTDFSLIIFKGNTLVACVLGCEYIEENQKIFFSHKGTTFGGIIIGKQIYNATSVNKLIDSIEIFLQKNSFDKIYLKMTPSVFQRKNTDLVDYFLYQKGYFQYTELNYYMHLERYRSDILSQFSSGKRRDYRYALRNKLEFKKLKKEQIIDFYNVLQLNLKKLNLKSVHSYDDLIDLKCNRFSDEIEFYGVFYESKMIAGSMVFLFDNKIMHTQYLASDENYLKMYPMDFLIYNLIKCAIEKNMHIFTFGICTENQGKYLNFGLSRFKEGFGTEYCLNKSFEKLLKTE